MEDNVSAPGQHAAEAKLTEDKDPTQIPVQLNKDGEEVFVKVSAERAQVVDGKVFARDAVPGWRASRACRSCPRNHTASQLLMLHLFALWHQLVENTHAACSVPADTTVSPSTLYTRVGVFRVLVCTCGSLLEMSTATGHTCSKGELVIFTSLRSNVD